MASIRLQGQLVHLLARFLGRFRSADEAGQKGSAKRFGHELREFGPVPAFRGEERPAEKQFGAEFFAAAVETAQLQHVVQGSPALRTAVTPLYR